jgi:DNA polymerase III alpha subunit/intein/homing endonuclease
MSNKSFVHLHVHADGSALDGLSQVKKMVPRALELGQTSLAITDHGSMSATYDLYKATKGTDLKPIYGIEAYLAPAVPRTHKEPVRWADGGGDDVSGAGAYTHMTMWAETNEGLHNLFRLSSEAYLTGFYRKPRMDEELLRKYHKGIIATTGCPSGEVQTWLRIGNYEKAKEAAAKFAEIFGEGNFFVELMDHGLEIERIVIPQLLQIAKELGLPTVATNDSHYTHQDDSHVHEALLCIGSGSKLEDPNRFKFDGNGYYLKTAEEMRAIWDHIAPDACDNTLLIAERCVATFEDGHNLMPEFPVPEGETESSLLEKEVMRGLETRYPAGVPEDRITQAKYEVDIINQMGFPGYFLVTADFIGWAKKNGIRVGPGRGCLSKDSNVLTPLGFKKISDIKVGDEVYDEKGAVVKVPAVFEYDCDEPLIEIKGFYGGNGNKMTADHKVLVSKARRVTNKQKLAQEYRFEPGYAEPIWVRADEVEVGDLVVTPKLLVEENIKGWKYEQISVSATNSKYEHSIRNIQKDTGIARGTLSRYYQDPLKASNSTILKIKEYFETSGLDLESELSKRHSVSVAQSDYVHADYNFGMLLGIFISDGWLRSNGRDSVGFAQRTSEDELVIPNLIQKVFGLPASSVPHKQKDVTSYTINHKGVAQLFREIFPDYAFTSCTKYIPEELFQTAEAFRRGLLEGLWYGDGSHKGNKSKYTTVSPQLAQGVFQLLGTLGLPAGIKSYKRTDKRPGREREWVEYSVVTAHNFDTSTLIVGKPFDGKFTYYRVREINIVPPEGKVYDFTVPTTNSYVTDSYVVHNSAAGSIVAYAMGITDIDPMKHGLMFERFLNPERVSMPDIDVDFDDRRRGEVIQYVIDKYGEDKVANITTFMSVKAKAAIKDAARVLNMPYMYGDALTKVYPQPIVGRDLSLTDAYDPSNERYDEAAEFRALAESNNEYKEIVKLARGLEGVRRGHGMHAAGVIMSKKPLVETVPLMRRDTNSPMMTQFEYPTCEYLGLLKMDFLGLSNLGTLDEALRLIKQNRGVEVDLDKVGEDLNDKATFELLARGETLGVFQLDSPPMRSLLKLMEPDQFEDISAVLALYRPGPMGAGSHIEYAERKNNRRPNTPIHPELEEALSEILGETYGLIVYQEQVMKVAQDLAGYSLGKADLLRRAMGKKDPKILAQEFAPFRDGMRANKYSDEAIQALWDVLVPFSDYAFNRAHTAGYGLVSYWTAYLKANFPAEYMAALLTTNADNKDKLALYLGECRRMGIKVLSPDVNESELNYTAVGEDIRVGLIGVKNVGEKVINAWLQIRKEGGPAKSFGDFLIRADGNLATKKTLESLVKAGGLDSFGHTRAAMFSVIEDALKISKKTIKAAAKNESLLFEDDSLDIQIDVPDISEWEKNEKLKLEREMLGLYVSDHPLGEYADAISLLSSISIADLRDAEYPPSDTVRLAGLISAVERKTTKKAGEPWALVTIEDLDSSINVFVFPKTYSQFSDLLIRDSVLLFTGKAEKRDDGSTSIIIQDISKPDLTLAQVKAERRMDRVERGDMTMQEAKSQPLIRKVIDPEVSTPIVVNVDEEQINDTTVNRLKDALLEYSGTRPVHIRMRAKTGEFKMFALPAIYNVTGASELAAEIRALFGPESV